MATIRKRGSSWQAQVRRGGYPPITKSFSTRADAAAWAREKERAIDRAELPANLRDFKGVTVADLLRRYQHEVTPRKRGEKFEQSRLRGLLNHRIAARSLDQLSGADVTLYREDRLRVVKPASVRRELTVLRHVFEIAKREWNVPLRENPVRAIKVPEDSKPRERRLKVGEQTRLSESVHARSGWYLRPFLLLAVETGMRRGELLSIRWNDVDLQARTARVLETKNGRPRTVPLTPKAVEVLASLGRIDDRVFPVTPNAVRLAWERLRRRSGLKDLRLHDLRHEAVSRFFELGLTVPEVALISGHRDTRMLMRYTHLRPEVVAEKLARLEGRGNHGETTSSAQGSGSTAT